MPRKDPNCPSCGGRSFDASGGSDDYHECHLCEEPTAKYVAWYRSRWPEVYDAWIAARRAAVTVPEGWRIGNPDWPAGDGPYLERDE